MITLFETKKIAFILAFAAHAVFFVLMDPDYYLHLMAGKYIVEHLSLPTGDVFSYTMVGQPWHLHEWLFEVLIYCIYILSGETGVVVWTSGLGVLAFYIAFNAGNPNNKGNYRAILFALLLFVFYQVFIKPRPQVITFLCYAIFLFVLFDFKYRNTLRFSFVLPPLMVVWTNVHGAYLLGIALLFLFTVSEYLNRRMRRENAWHDEKFRRLIVITGLTALASAINPYFVKHWAFPFTLMNSQAMNFIVEWHSLSFSDSFERAYLLLLAAFVIHYVYVKNRPDLTELLLPGFVILSSFFAARHIPLAILTMLPFALATSGRGYEVKNILPAGIVHFFQDRINRGQDIGEKEYLVNGAILFIVCVSLIFFTPLLSEQKRGKRNAYLPVKAVDYILEKGISGRLLNTYHYGGYLIYRLYPQQRVFIDIRADMYGDQFIRDYITIYFGQEGWERIFDRYHFDYVLCENNAVIRKFLLYRGDYRLAYHDSSHSVLLRKLN